MNVITAARRLLATAAILSLLILAWCSRVPSPTRPNVLLIVADDLGYNDLAINNGNSAIRTPALDELAREGVRFTHHYADAVCSPARAALLSGMHPARLGFSPNGRGISPEFVTLAEALQSAGYRTMHIGKWHIGDTVREAWPDRQGFEHWFGFLNQWFLAGAQENGHLVAAQPRHTDPWLMRDGDAGARYTGYLDDILTDEAVRQITERAGKPDPWFLNLWYYAPHAPVTPAPRFATQFPDTPDGKYRALVLQLDSNVGRVLQALERTGQARNTLVVLVSDNGGTAQNAKDSNEPFYGAKATFWEGGLRTPLVIRWPDGHVAGSLRADAVTIYDIYPTILARLGIDPPPGLDGLDVGTAPAPARDLFWESFADGHYGYSALREGRWRSYYTWPYAPVDTPPVLYDVSAPTHPPAGPRNLGPELPELLADMEQARRSWQRDVHRVALLLAREPDGRRELRGLDFLRSPGFGGFSFAIGIGPGYSGTVAAQEGIWSMALSADGELNVDFQGRRLQARTNPGACNSAIVSSWFARRTSNWPEDKDRMRIELYLNGERAAAVSEDGKLDDHAFAPPTRIGDSASGAPHGLLGDPLVFNAPLDASDAWRIPDMHRDLCAAQGSGTDSGNP